MVDIALKNILNCTVSYTALPRKTDLHFQLTLSLVTKFPTDFNSSLLCFPTIVQNVVALTYIFSTCATR